MFSGLFSHLLFLNHHRVGQVCEAIMLKPRRLAPQFWMSIDFWAHLCFWGGVPVVQQDSPRPKKNRKPLPKADLTMIDFVWYEALPLQRFAALVDLCMYANSRVFESDRFRSPRFFSPHSILGKIYAHLEHFFRFDTKIMIFAIFYKWQGYFLCLWKSVLHVWGQLDALQLSFLMRHFVFWAQAVCFSEWSIALFFEFEPDDIFK